MCHFNRMIMPLPSFRFDTADVDCIYEAVARNFLDVPVHCLYFKLPSLSLPVGSIMLCTKPSGELKSWD